MSPLSRLAGLAYEDQDPIFLEEMRKAKYTYDLETAALALSEWTGRGHEEMRAHGLRVIADCVRAEFKDARDAIEWLISKDRRLGVWCACVCIREVVSFFPKDDKRPLIALETTEAWVRGKTTNSKVREASRNANNCFYDLLPGRWRGTALSALAVAKASDAAKAANTNNASFAARASVERVAEISGVNEKSLETWGYLLKKELRHLVEVMADGIMTFPQKRAKNSR